MGIPDDYTLRNKESKFLDDTLSFVNKFTNDTLGNVYYDGVSIVHGMEDPEAGKKVDFHYFFLGKGYASDTGKSGFIDGIEQIMKKTIDGLFLERQDKNALIRQLINKEFKKAIGLTIGKKHDEDNYYFDLLNHDYFKDFKVGYEVEEIEDVKFGVNFIERPKVNKTHLLNIKCPKIDVPTKLEDDITKELDNFAKDILEANRFRTRAESRKDRLIDAMDIVETQDERKIISSVYSNPLFELTPISGMTTFPSPPPSQYRPFPPYAKTKDPMEIVREKDIEVEKRTKKIEFEKKTTELKELSVRIDNEEKNIDNLIKALRIKIKHKLELVKDLRINNILEMLPILERQHVDR